jgi:clan AA aspartic protease
MRGSVNAPLEAKLHLTIIGPAGIRQDVDAVIDTGFTGALVLPAAIVSSLGLLRRSGGTATLADGTTCNYDNFAAEVEWDGSARSVLVSAVGHEALAGMVLLAGHRLTVDVEDGGEVEVQSLEP